jgi:hypothetical protein
VRICCSLNLKEWKSGWKNKTKNGNAHPAESQSAKKKNATDAVHYYTKVPIKRSGLPVKKHLVRLGGRRETNLHTLK